MPALETATHRRRRRLRPLVIAGAFVSALVTVSSAQPAGDAPGATQVHAPGAATSTVIRAVAPAIARDGPPTGGARTRCIVRFAVDGDTVDVTSCADAGRIRLILVDAPEAQGCFAADATAFARRRLPAGSVVELERDTSDVDVYGRYLRYVWIDGELLNETLVREGYARMLSIPPDLRYRERILAAERIARDSGLGLWAGCYTATATAQPPTPTAVPGGRDSCHPSYPTLCVPPPPPDLDCRDIAQRRFPVLSPDPHRFDGDGDGFGCES